jgi:glycolate oxidase iron-sulfur subunit
MIPLESLKEIAEKCVRCGICQSVCPVFAELQREASVARGKVSLIRELLLGGIDYSQRVSTNLLQCLGCGACSENCPNGVKADELILGARMWMVGKKGLSLPKRLIVEKILNSVHLLPALLKTASLLRGLALKKIPGESGLHLRFSLPYLDRRRLIPSIAPRFFLDLVREKEGGNGGQKKIGLFAGCSINYLFPSVGKSTVRLMERNGYGAVIPKGQACCGLPAYGSGAIEAARSLARRNVKAFGCSDGEPIMVPCSSCFYFLKEGYPKLFPEDEEVKAFSRRVVEPSTFFINLMDAFRSANSDPSREEGLRPRQKKVRLTYHDPCHLRRGMKIFEQPRRLLRSLAGVEFVEMKNPSRCCGMGGSFNFIYYDLSQRIMQHKADDIEAANVESVVTSCMGCIIQLRDGLAQRGMGTEVIHLVELLDQAWGDL